LKAAAAGMLKLCFVTSAIGANGPQAQSTPVVQHEACVTVKASAGTAQDSVSRFK
jgi:hypothetical protein